MISIKGDIADVISIKGDIVVMAEAASTAPPSQHYVLLFLG